MREGLSKVCCGMLPGVWLCCAAASAQGAIEYDSVNLHLSPQAVYDIAESRPALKLNRPAVGAINIAGQLTGKGDAGTGQLNPNARPFFYDPAEHTTANLGDLSGDFADPNVTPRNDASQGLGINDLGWVAGVSSTATVAGVADDRPFLWADDDGNHANTSGEMHELALNPGATYGSALRVNNNGQVLVNGDTGLYRASVSLNAGVLTETAARVLVNGTADSADLNDAGEVGYTQGNAGYVWRDLDNNQTSDPGETTQIPFMSGTWQNSSVLAINNAGQVVGTVRNDNIRDIGYIWTDLDNDNVVDWDDTNTNGIFEWDETSDEMFRFHDTPGGINAAVGSTFVFDINDHGVAVGVYFDTNLVKAIIYEPETGVRRLDDLTDPAFPLQLWQALAINNNGQIAAFGRELGGSVNKLALLSPLNQSIAGDLDGDGFVGIADLNIVLGNWNQSVTPGDLLLGDPSGDGFVGIEDLNEVLGNWNAGTPAGNNVDIPEPGTAPLLCTMLGWMCRRRR